MRKTIRLNENELKCVICESVKNFLSSKGSRMTYDLLFGEHNFAGRGDGLLLFEQLV